MAGKSYPVRLNNPADMVDNAGMNRPRYSYRIVQPTQHWRLVAGQWRRDHIAVRSDGQVRVVSLPDGSLAA
jgi:uncharacterized protein (DUF2237 family)